MSKLEAAMRDAEQNNLGKDVADKAKNKAESKAKNKAKDMAVDTTKKAGRAAHRFMSKHSKAYRGVGKVLSKGKGALKVAGAAGKAALKAAAVAAKAVISFLITPPAGWIVSAIIIAIVISVVKSGALDNLDDLGNMGSGGSLSYEEQLLYFDNVCAMGPTSGVVSDDIGDSDWTTEGTTANKNAKKIFTYWVDKGVSGAGAAGIVGWINSEGGFAMFGRAEGVYETDPKKGSLKHSVEPIPYGDYPKGGGGVYQFTPYDKFAPLGSSDWEDSDKINDFVFNAIKGGDWVAEVDMTGDGNSFKGLAEQTDPQHATLIWNAYERADQSTVKVDQKKGDAQKAFDIFEGSKYTYDEKRFTDNFGSEIDDKGRSSSVYVDPCRPAGGSSWRGSGGQPSTASGTWRLSDVPMEIQEYALDPRSIGMQPKDRSTWLNLVSPKGTGGQCTDLSASLMEAMWTKDGSALKTAGGNGIDVVPNLSARHNVDSSSTPTGGAIFSSRASTAYGHTGIVSHVFDNGDFLIIEQNIGGFSGDNNFRPLTWNYRYIKSSNIARQGYKFFNPADAGYDFVSGIASLS